MTKEIEVLCQNTQIPIVGKIKFDKSIVESMVSGKTIMETSFNDIKKKHQRNLAKNC